MTACIATVLRLKPLPFTISYKPHEFNTRIRWRNRRGWNGAVERKSEDTARTQSRDFGVSVIWTPHSTTALFVFVNLHAYHPVTWKIRFRLFDIKTFVGWRTTGHQSFGPIDVRTTRRHNIVDNVKRWYYFRINVRETPLRNIVCTHNSRGSVSPKTVYPARVHSISVYDVFV